MESCWGSKWANPKKGFRTRCSAAWTCSGCQLLLLFFPSLCTRVSPVWPAALNPRLSFLLKASRLLVDEGWQSGTLIKNWNSTADSAWLHIRIAWVIFQNKSSSPDIPSLRPIKLEFQKMGLRHQYSYIVPRIFLCPSHLRQLSRRPAGRQKDELSLSWVLTSWWGDGVGLKFSCNKEIKQHRRECNGAGGLGARDFIQPR